MNRDDLRAAVALAGATAAFTLSLLFMDRVNVWLSTGAAAILSLGLAAWAGGVPLPRRRLPRRRTAAAQAPTSGPGAPWEEPRPLRNLLEGTALGAVLVVATHLAYRLAVLMVPALDGVVAELYGDLAVPPGPVAALPLTAVVVLAEEAVWRGVLVDRLLRRLGPAGRPGEAAPAESAAVPDRRRFGRTSLVVLATLLYGVPHLLAGEAILLAAALCLGAVWTVLRLRTGGLAAPFACHLTWSATLFAIWPLT